MRPHDRPVRGVIFDLDGTLLDHSMIAYGSGIHDGNSHNHEDLPILLAGVLVDATRGLEATSDGDLVAHAARTRPRALAR